MIQATQLLATFSKVCAVTAEEFSVLVTAERLVNIEVGLAIRHGGPLALTGAVVDGQTEVTDAVCLEVSAVTEPPPDLAAQVVAHCVGPAGVDQVPVAGVQRQLALLVQLQQTPIRANYTEAHFKWQKMSKTGSH